jgi:hypothetical protein
MRKSMLDRRTFLQAGGAVLAGLPFARRVSLAQPASGPAVLYAGRFVPAGAECKIAFASDHHYWPGHPENWGGGGQITTSTDRRMPDLAAVLNEEQPGLSIHAGDVISAGGSFFPPPEEYARQLAFTQGFYKRLSHPFVPMLGNHETLEALYDREAQLEPWIRHFGPPYRHHDLKGWRFVAVNCLLPNPNSRHGRGDSYGNVFGLDPVQMDWLRRTLQEASTRGLKAVVCTHVPPRGWVNAAEFEKVIASAGCVRAVLCGHTHRNSMSLLGGVPVIIRVANVTTPFGYTMVHCYPDGRLILVQKSQHFPFEDFISASLQTTSPLGAEADRYLTLGGASQLPLDQLKVIGNDAQAALQDGHLRLTARNERALVLIDTAALNQARLTLTAVKAAAERIGGIALAAPDGAGGIEAAVTSRYSPDGKVYLARGRSGGREVLARSWFNIADNIAYRLTLEVRKGRIRASWKNMLDLEATVDTAAPGHFGFFVDRGTMFVTDLKLERLA